MAGAIEFSALAKRCLDRRIASMETLEHEVLAWCKERLVYLRSVKQAVLVVKQIFTNKDGSQGCLYLVSSDTSLNYEQITTIYKRRWKVEEYHKSLKQNTSLGASPTKTPHTQANHFFASMLAYIKREALKIKCSIGHFRLKAQLYTVGLKAMHQHLAQLSA